MNFYFLLMIIWLIALVLLGLLGLVGYFQGGIRVGISLIGLFFAAFLAMPLSPVIKPILPIFGMKHPLWLPIIPPLVIFILIMIIFKIVAYTVHQKVSVYYKYKTNDKTCLKWERLNQRLGLTLGFINGAVYFVLLLIPIYVAGYLTTQVASGAQDTAGMRFINQTRAQLHDSKADRVVAAYDPASKNFYEAADIVGLLKSNPLLNSRLSRYPVFLLLAEKKEFQDLRDDLEFNNLIQTQAKISDIIKHPKAQAILTNSTITAEMEKLLGPDLKDLHEYLLTGKSAKYDDERILGYWVLNLDATVNQEKGTPFEKQRLKQTKYAIIRGFTFVATTDGKAILKNTSATAGAAPTVLADGTWKAVGSGYEVAFSGKNIPVTFEKGKLIVPNNDMTLVFEKEQ
ncbi:MAG: CvpA family protein [Verrucomicrobiota bacterium]